MSSVMHRDQLRREVRIWEGRNNRNVIVKSENKVEVKSNERKPGSKPRSAYMLLQKVR